MQRKKGDSERPQFFPPVPSIVSEYRLDIVFINREMIAADSAAAVSGLIIVADALLVSKGNLGIRD